MKATVVELAHDRIEEMLGHKTSVDNMGGAGHRQHGIDFMNSEKNEISCLGLGVGQREV